MGEPVATQLRRRDKAAPKNCVLITRTSCHGIRRGQFPFQGVILGSGSFPIELDHFLGPPSGARACTSGSTDRLPRTGKRRGARQRAGAAAVSPRPPIGANVFITNEILQRINVTLFQRVTVIALHVITLPTWHRVPVLASWRDNALTSHRSTVLPLHGMTLMRL